MATNADYCRRNYLANRDARIAYQKAYGARIDPETKRAVNKAYYTRNQEKVQARCANYRARLASIWRNAWSDGNDAGER